MPEVIARSLTATRIRTDARLWQFFTDNKISFGPHTHEHIRTMEVPHDCLLEKYTLFNNGGHILTSMGMASYQMTGAAIGPMGRYCSVGAFVTVMGERHPIEHVTASSFPYHQGRRSFDEMRRDFGITKRVPPTVPDGPLPILGHDVWVGDGATLARGITLGHGCVVGADAVVTKNVAPYTIVAGVPARPIRRRFSDEIIEQLLALEWWYFHPRVLFDHDIRDPAAFVASVRAAKSALEPYMPRAVTAADILAVD